QIEADGTWILDLASIPGLTFKYTHFNIDVTLRVTNPTTGETTDTLSINHNDVGIDFPLDDARCVIRLQSGEDAVINAAENGINLNIGVRAIEKQLNIYENTAVDQSDAIQFTKEDNSPLGDPHYAFTPDKHIADGISEAYIIFIGRDELEEGDNLITARYVDPVTLDLGPKSEVFTITVDTIAPTNQTKTTPTTADLILTFNEAMKLGTGTINIYQEKNDFKDDKVRTLTLINGQVDNSRDIIHFNADKTQLTIGLANDLETNSAYYATITTGAIVDMAGNAYAGIALGNSTSAWTFTTSTEQAPRITGWTINTPENGHTGFGVGDTVNITLNTSKALKFATDASTSEINIANKVFKLDDSQGAGKVGASATEQKQALFSYTVLSGDAINGEDFKFAIDAITLVGISDAHDNTLITRPGDAHPIAGLMANTHRLDGAMPEMLNNKINTVSNAITFTFDEDLQPNTQLTASDFKQQVGSGAQQSLNGNLTIATNTLTLTPDSAFASNAITRLTYVAGDNKITDTAGNAIKKVSLYYGTNGAEVITGSNEEDILIGGGGNDTLTGGGGKDTFQYDASTDGHDTIMDFSVGSAGDVLDLSNLLVGYNFIGTLAEFVSVAYTAEKTVITVDANGSADNAGMANLDITLHGDFKTEDDKPITLQMLVDEGNLVPAYNVPTTLNVDATAADETVAKVVSISKSTHGRRTSLKTEFGVHFDKGFDVSSAIYIKDFVITKTTQGEQDSILNIETAYILGSSIVLQTDLSYNQDALKNSIIHITYNGVGLKDESGRLIEKNTSVYFGSNEVNTIIGSDGDDFIFGSGGNDVLTGGKGSDIFQHGQGADAWGDATITDFDIGLTSGSDKDKLGLDRWIFQEGYTLTALSQHMSISYDNNNTLIAVNNAADGISAQHMVITLQGVTTTLEEMVTNGNLILG
ncbi:MAG: type I secretion C-terminal target domain-containing protein, partial [Gammaproteobacteria bacterium]|nr:type I secretion C-terminal target domain-containing protein [Gammaproteobacteria bacterium]